MDEKKFIISCTPAAINKAKEQIIKRAKETRGIRIGLRGGGCNGFSIIIEFVDIISEKDHVFTFDNVSFYIDPKSMIYLNNMEIDYETKIMGNGFKFNIPEKKGACGCGSSISF